MSSFAIHGRAACGADYTFAVEWYNAVSLVASQRALDPAGDAREDGGHLSSEWVAAAPGYLQDRKAIVVTATVSTHPTLKPASVDQVLTTNIGTRSRRVLHAIASDAALDDLFALD